MLIYAWVGGFAVGMGRAAVSGGGCLGLVWFGLVCFALCVFGLCLVERLVGRPGIMRIYEDMNIYAIHLHSNYSGISSDRIRPDRSWYDSLMRTGKEQRYGPCTVCVQSTLCYSTTPTPDVRAK